MSDSAISLIDHPKGSPLSFYRDDITSVLVDARILVALHDLHPSSSDLWSLLECHHNREGVVGLHQ